MKKVFKLMGVLTIVILVTTQLNTSQIKAGIQEGQVPRVSGTIQQGVEAGCIVIKDQCTGKTFLLLGDLDGFTIGDQVCIIGRPLNVITFCQQGQPLGIIRITGGPCPGRCPGGN